VAGGQALAELLKRSSAPITSLDLDSNNIGAEGARHLAEALEVNSSLQRLGLCGNRLGAEGWCAIFGALRDNKDNKIESWEWDLQEERAGPEVAKVLAEYVSASTAVRSLNVQCLSKEGAKAIVQAAQTKPQLMTLCGCKPEYTEANFSDQKLNVGDVILLAFDLTRNSGLVKLDLSGNRLGAEAAKHLSNALVSNQSLVELHLGGNDIGPEGAKHLAQALKANSTIQRLGLDRSQLCGLNTRLFGFGAYSAEGIIAISDMLRVNRTLRSVSLYVNYLGPEGARHIAAALGSNSSLEHLGLENNELCGLDGNGVGTYTAEGIVAISDMLRVNRTLRSVRLTSNHLGAYYDGSKWVPDSSGVTALAEALKQNSTLTTLDVRNNNIDAAAKKLLRDAAKGKRVELLLD